MMEEKNKTSIDEMVDKIISKHEKKPEETKQKTDTTPTRTPFRYLNNKEIIEELQQDEENFQTKKIPDDPSQAAKLWEDFYVIGESKKIESIIQKHEKDKKNKIV